MMKEVLKKIFSGVATVALLINSLVAPLTVYSQEDISAPADTPVLTDELTPTPIETPTPTPEEALPTPSPEPEPTVELTPTSFDEITPTTEKEVTPTPVEDVLTPTPELTINSEIAAEEENSNTPGTSTEGDNSTNESENPIEPTPTVTPVETEEGILSAVIIEETLAESVSEFDFEYQESTSAQLVTDKPDYAPTDAVVIFGSGFLPGKEYTLEITSETGNFKFGDTVTSDESGSLFYTYQLDGTYRPLYLVEALNSDGEIVASATFTDSPPSGCFNDSAGVNDEPGQKDLTKACVNYTGLPTSLGIDWNWDEIAWSGQGQTGDACSLYDTDDDGFANFSLCVRVSGDPATFQNHVLFSCTDTKVDRCSGSAIVTNTSSCSASVQATDPFPAGDEYPDDTGASCTVNMSDVGGGTASLLDVCSYPSQQPNSDPSDCVFASTASQTGLLEVKKVLSPTDDTGLFNLQIDGTSFAVNVGNGGTTGEKIVEAGDRTVGETAGTGTTLTDYQTSIECRGTNGTGAVVASSSNAGPLTVNVANNADIVCIITNTRNTGTLRVIKNVVVDDGGTASAGDFTIHVKQNGSDVVDSPQSGSASGTVYTLPTGTYEVSEDTLPSGYSFEGFSESCDSQGNVTVISGQEVTCTLTNDDIQPKLTVTKIVTNDNGGTLEVSDFPLFVDQTSVTSGVENGFSAGTYTVSETQQPGYSETISGDCAPDGSITLDIGDIKSCTITNDDQQGTLIVVKVVINDNGGTFEADDFSFSVNSGESQSFEADGQNDITVNAGSYSVIENSLPGYEATYDNCDQVYVANGDSATCTITNDDIAPILTLVKTVINDNGGEKEISDFQLFINGDPVVSGQENTLTAGVLYTASETTDPGYAASNWGEDCNSDGTITLAPGDDKTCTITNDDQYGHLIVQKTTDPSGDQTQFPITAEGDGVITGGAEGTVTDENDKDYEVTPGTYSVSEDLSNLPNWSETANTCVDVQVEAGETETCIITNTKLGLVTVQKVTDPAGDQENFTFEGVVFGQIADGGTLISDYLSPGQYSATEVVPSGWDLTSIQCSDTDSQGNLEDATATFNVQAGEEVECTFTNTKRSHLIVEKVTIPDGNQTEFEITAQGDGVITDGGEGLISTQSSWDYEVTPGTYSVTEAPEVGWDETGNTCADVSVAAGQTETCQIENTKRGNVIVTKYHDHDIDGIQDEGDEQLSDWDINLGDLTQVTDENGQATFENVLPGNYNLNEVLEDSWNQTNISCGEEGGIDNDNEHPIQINPGNEIRCSIGNYKDGQIEGTKWNDEDGNGERDEETGIPDWAIFIDENENGLLDGLEDSVQTDQDGNYVLTGLKPGTYRVCEGQETGWIQTHPDDAELNDCYELEITSGDIYEGIDFGNQETILGLSIEKSNDKSVAIRGDTVTFTLLIINNSNQQTQNLSILDVLPGGFTYVTGSSEVNGAPSPDPTIASGVMTWNIGTLDAGVDITIVYQAKIATDLTAGTYENLATCRGEGFSLIRVRFLGDVECDPSASSSVRVEVNPSYSGNVGGTSSVLGASTSLPAAGSETALLVIALGGLIVGIFLKREARKYEKN